jgi:hypothetical protein
MDSDAIDPLRAFRACNSARHISLKARSGSIASLSISSRNSGNVLFGAKYVLTIARTTASAFSTTQTDERAQRQGVARRLVGKRVRFGFTGFAAISN